MDWNTSKWKKSLVFNLHLNFFGGIFLVKCHLFIPFQHFKRNCSFVPHSPPRPADRKLSKNGNCRAKHLTGDCAKLLNLLLPHPLSSCLLASLESPWPWPMIDVTCELVSFLLKNLAYGPKICGFCNGFFLPMCFDHKGVLWRFVGWNDLINPISSSSSGWMLQYRPHGDFLTRPRLWSLTIPTCHMSSRVAIHPPSPRHYVTYDKAPTSPLFPRHCLVKLLAT